MGGIGFVAILSASCALLYVAAVTFGVGGARYFRYAPYFLAGICIYYYGSTRSAVALAGLIAGCLGAVYEAMHPAGGASFALGPLMAGVAAGGACVMGLARMDIDNKWKHFDKKAGDLSYPLYLNHHAAILLCARLVPSRNLGVLLLALVVSLGLAWLLNLVTEPVLKTVRDRVRGQGIA